MSEPTARTSPEPLHGPVVALTLHGYGSSEDDLAGLAPYVVPGLPWASLRAPLVLGRGSYARFHGGVAARTLHPHLPRMSVTGWQRWWTRGDHRSRQLVSRR